MLLYTILFILFLSYFVSVVCNEKNDRPKTVFFIAVFSVCVIILNGYSPPSITSDYVYYTQNYNYEFRDSFVFSDLLVSVQYNLISVFVSSKKQVVLIMFFLLKLYFLLFAIWLVFTEIETYKKILFFSIMYFFCSSVLLRNGPSYLLVFVGLYYLFRKGKVIYSYPILAILCHFSALIPIVSYIKLKFNKEIMLKGLAVILVVFLLVFYNILDVSLFINKIIAYTNLHRPLNLYHKIWVFFILGITTMAFFENKKSAIKYNILIYALFYFILLFVHVAPAFRVSLYLLIVYCNIPITNSYIKQYLPKVNLASFMLIIVYVMSYFKTHHIEFMLS